MYYFTDGFFYACKNDNLSEYNQLLFTFSKKLFREAINKFFKNIEQCESELKSLLARIIPE